jgi:hypothetical protein
MTGFDITEMHTYQSINRSTNLYSPSTFAMTKLWGRNPRVVAVRSRPAQAQNAFVPVMAPETDWIARALDMMKLIGSAGEMVAFPYIKGAANVVVALLEPIQVCVDNSQPLIFPYLLIAGNAQKP